MFTRVIKYSNKHFDLFDLINDITDARAKPQIATSDIAVSIFHSRWQIENCCFGEL